MRRQLSPYSTITLLLAYGVLALIVTWPLALHFRDAVIGDPESDVWKHVWGMWWVRHSLVTEHALPLYTHLLNYPYGGSLFFIDPLGGLFAFPLQTYLTPAEAFNTVVLCNIVFACLAAFWLARYFTHSAPAAFVAGVIYGCSPYLLSNIVSGISETFNVGWIPLFILFYTRTLREPRISNPVTAGVLLGVATIGSWYYGVICGLYATCAAIFETVRRLVSRTGQRTSGHVVWVTLWGTMRRLRVLAVAVLSVVTLSALHGMVTNANDMFTEERGLTDALKTALCTGFAAWVFAVIPHLGRTAPTDVTQPSRLRRAGHDAGAAGALACAWVMILVTREVCRGSLDFAAALLGLVALAGLWLSLRLMAGCGTDRTRARAATVVGIVVSLLAAGGSLWLLNATWTWPNLDTAARSAVAAGWLLSVLVLWHRRAWWRGLHLPSMKAYYARQAGTLVLRTVAVFGAGFVLAYAWLPPENASAQIQEIGALFVFSMCAAHGIDLIRELWRRSLQLVDETAQRLELAWAHHLARTLLWRIAVVAGVGALVVLPVATVFKHTLNGELSLVYRVRNAQNVDLHLSEQFHNISRLEDYVMPGREAAVQTYTVDRLTRVSYAGYVVLTLSIAAVLFVRRKYVRWWGCVAAAAILYSTGPFLYVTSGIHLDEKFPPYMWMFDWFPFFSQISIPFRFDVIAMLAMATLSAYTLAALLRHREPEIQILTSLAFALAIVIELVTVSPLPFPLPLSSVQAPAVLQKIADNGDGGVLDLPYQRFEGELLPGEYFFYQTVHHHPIPSRVEGQIPFFVRVNPFLDTLFDLEHDWTGYDNEPEAVLDQAVEEMHDFGFDYIIVHENLLRAGASERLRVMLEHFLGPPRWHEDGIAIYRVALRKTP